MYQNLLNFQSLKDVTAVIDGMTVVTGPNNSGKTALMRAVFEDGSVQGALFPATAAHEPWHGPANHHHHSGSDARK